MKENNPLDEYFKAGLEGHEIQPSASVWDKIEAGVETKGSRKTGVWLLLRAAMITIFLGLSTWVFYQNNDFKVGDANPMEEITFTRPTITDSPAQSSAAKEEKGNESRKDSGKEEKTTTPEKEKKQSKVIPIMTQPVKSKSIYVKAEEAPAVIDESMLVSSEKWTPDNSVVLDAERVSANKVTPIKVKFKLKPATTPAFYADNSERDVTTQEDKPGFKEKVYAYANNQFENLLAGRPLELPKPERKPQLEIDLGKIFNN